MTLLTTKNDSRNTYIFAGVAVVFAVGLSVAQNLKLLPNQQGIGAFVDLGFGSRWLAFGVVLVSVVAAGAVAFLSSKYMGGLVACALAAVTGACCFLRYEPAIGAFVGCVVGGIVASSEFRNALFGALKLVIPALFVGVLGTMAWRDFGAPLRFIGPLFCVAFLVAYVWWRWPRPFRIGIIVPWIISVGLVWFGLTIDTFLRVPSPDGLVWNSDPVKCLTTGLFDIQNVWGAFSSNRLRRLRSYGNIRTIDIHPSIEFDSASLGWIKNPGGVVHLGICDSHLSAEGAASLQRFVGIQRLWLFATQIDESALVNLKTMTRLSHLMLSHTDVSDEDLRNLVNVTSLMTLELQKTPITDAGLESLRGHPGLNRVNLRETLVTGTGVPALVAGQLEFSLNLQKTKVTDETASCLEALGQIAAVKIDLSDTEIGDDALVHIGKIATLTQLKLAGTNVSDDGLKHLTKLSSLVSLDVAETNCTPAGIGKLEAALPKLDVAWFE